jgi:hypothetical protein
MPRASYRVDWVSDTTAEVLQSDTFTGDSATLGAPPFARHLAVVVAKTP